VFEWTGGVSLSNRQSQTLLTVSRFEGRQTGSLASRFAKLRSPKFQIGGRFCEKPAFAKYVSVNRHFGFW
jgi:hypothetical protein